MVLIGKILIIWVNDHEFGSQEKKKTNKKQKKVK